MIPTSSDALFPAHAEPARTASASAVPVHDPDLPAWNRRFLALDRRVLSIRLPEKPGTVACCRCGGPFLAAGPTGHRDDEPLCDLCLLESSRELGMVLALVAVVRAFAVGDYERAEEYWEALFELGAFARIYEHVAARSGPPRLLLLMRRPWNRRP